MDLLHCYNIYHHDIKYFSILRSNDFHHFVKITLTKNPKKRPSSDKLLQVDFCLFSIVFVGLVVCVAVSVSPIMLSS